MGPLDDVDGRVDLSQRKPLRMVVPVGRQGQAGLCGGNHCGEGEGSGVGDEYDTCRSGRNGARPET